MESARLQAKGTAHNHCILDDTVISHSLIKGLLGEMVDSRSRAGNIQDEPGSFHTARKWSKQTKNPMMKV